MAEYEAALARISELLEASDPDGIDELETWSLLVEHYEAERFPMDAPDPVAYLRAVMDLKGLTQADLAAVIGARSRASEVLAGRRSLSKEMIRKIGEAWSIPVEPLLARKPGPTQAAE